ncbi:hypothetical protein E2562_024281 [Oryza meyeriana var. granulata]|uniref:VWFA domain-containing protein n=1 Tax=Oryza meyeriana var. granulata TaxID=110450 RepID=A0A6G1C8F4_9ORYZ|nr:hypothetical protein E2562_024281 [Oryza meyeriana var. granulata]
MGLQVMALLACLFSVLLFPEVSAISGTAVKVTTTPIFPKIPRDKTNKDFQMLLCVEAPAAADLKGRVIPIDLVVVLEVAGEKCLALVETAMKFAIQQLNNDDRLVVIGPRRPNAQPSTGLDEALKMLEGSSDDKRAKFIMLVTDNDDNSRFSNMPEWFNTALNKYPVHTFGLGASHDAAALRLIAHRSRGTYSFLDDQNVDKIARALALCLGGLKSVAAVGTRVVLKAVNGSGVRIDKVSSGGYASSIAQGDRTSGEIAIGALYAGEVKNFIVHLDVPAATEPTPGDDGVCCNQRQLLVVTLEGQFCSGIDGDGPIQAVLIVERPPTAVLPMPKVPSSMVVNYIFQFQWLEIVDVFINEEILAFPPIGADSLGAKLQVKWDQFVLDHQFWRPTAMGSPDNVVISFATLEVHLTLQQATITVVNGGTTFVGNSPCCVDQEPPSLLVPSEYDDNSYRFNPAYDGVISLDDINKLVSKIYQGMVKANNLKHCVPSHSAEQPMDPPMRAT